MHTMDRSCAKLGLRAKNTIPHSVSHTRTGQMHSYTHTHKTHTHTYARIHDQVVCKARYTPRHNHAMPTAAYPSPPAKCTGHIQSARNLQHLLGIRQAGRQSRTKDSGSTHAMRCCAHAGICASKHIQRFVGMCADRLRPRQQDHCADGTTCRGHLRGV